MALITTSILEYFKRKQNELYDSIFLKIKDVARVAITGSYNDLKDKPSSLGKVVEAGVIGTKEDTKGYSFEVPWIEVNEQGQVIAYGTHTHTVEYDYADSVLEKDESGDYSFSVQNADSDGVFVNDGEDNLTFRDNATFTNSILTSDANGDITFKEGE